MRRGLKKAIRFITVAVFFIAVSIPLLNRNFCLIPVEPPFGEWENRNPAPEVSPDIYNIEPFPQEYENYFNDNFPFRQILLKSYIYIKYKLFNQSPFPEKVIIGKDGWLYEGAIERDIYEGVKKITDDTLEMIIDELHCRAKKYKENNIRLFVAFAPSKYRIYPEYLPDYIVKRNDYAQKLIDRLCNDSLITYIPLEPVLLENKKKINLYHKNDNHWNLLGGLYAANEILRVMSREISGIEPNDLSLFRIETSSDIRGNLSDMTGMKEYFTNLNVEPRPMHPFKSHPGAKANYPVTPWFPYPDWFEVVRQIDTVGLPRLLVIRDSFTDAVVPFLSEKFQKVVYIFDSWQYKENQNIVDSEKPDAVLILIFEPHIKNMVKNRDCK